MIPRPEPGVSQLIVENKNAIGDTRFARPNRATFTVNIAALGVKPTPAAIVIDRSSTKTSSTQEITFTNRLGSFGGASPHGIGRFVLNYRVQ